MSYFFELVITGISLGLVYGLIAIGFVIVFKSTTVLNFAHGSLLLTGAYVLARVREPLGFWLAAVVAIAATALLALLIDTVILRRVQGADAGTLAILMLGVDILLLTELTRRIGNDLLSLDAPWGSDVLEFAGMRLPTSRAVAALVAIVVLLALAALFKYTDWGIAMRAAAADGEAASLMGISLRRVGAIAWILAGTLAAVAGVFLTSFPSPGVSPSVALVALAAIPAWVLGGFDSIPGAVVGGLVIGVVSALTTGYESDLSFLGRGLGEVTPYAVMFLVLLVRPSGLFGSEGVHRV